MLSTTSISRLFFPNARYFQERRDRGEDLGGVILLRYSGVGAKRDPVMRIAELPMPAEMANEVVGSQVVSIDLAGVRLVACGRDPAFTRGVTTSPATSSGELIMKLVDIVGRIAPPDGVAWLTNELAFDRPQLASFVDRTGEDARPADDTGRAAARARFAAAFAAAGRRLGRERIGEANAARLAAAGLPSAAESGADECGRAALVLAALASLAPAEHVPMVRDLLRRGEIRERQAVLRVLAGLPDPARFVELAVDACRSNMQSVFEALARDNAYPARYFADPAYFQMVLKALFVGAPLAHVVGLAERTTPELVRMVEAYASERRAAGRPVPPDVALIRSLHR
jgi:hypothetical protein